MKKIILCNLFTILLLVSCSSDNEDNIQKDDVLSNTEWVSSYGYAISTPETQYYPEIKTILAYIQGTYPPIDLSSVTIEEVELLEKDTILVDLINESRIRFINKDCFYSNKDISYWEEKELKNQYRRVKLIAQEGKSKSGRICRILPDGIYLIDNPDYTEGQRLFLKLENYEYKEKVSSSILSNNEFINTEDKINIAMFFERTDNNIIIRNDSIEWIGLLNDKRNIIEIEQINPKEEYIGEFEKN